PISKKCHEDVEIIECEESCNQKREGCGHVCRGDHKCFEHAKYECKDCKEYQRELRKQRRREEEKQREENEKRVQEEIEKLKKDKEALGKNLDFVHTAAVSLSGEFIIAGNQKSMLSVWEAGKKRLLHEFGPE
ncbi:MAG: hypothetical protein AAF514_20070, partial [Verrucomicrobiota bacterium]